MENETESGVGEAGNVGFDDSYGEGFGHAYPLGENDPPYVYGEGDDSQLGMGDGAGEGSDWCYGADHT